MLLPMAFMIKLLSAQEEVSITTGRTLLGVSAALPRHGTLARLHRRLNILV